MSADQITQPAERTAEGGFVCAECGYPANTRRGLDQHRRMKHEGGAAKLSSKAKKPAGARPATVSENVTGFYMLVADLWEMTGDPMCPAAMRQTIPGAAAQWESLARNHDWVSRFWVDMGAAAGWPALIVVHLPVLFAIYAHHIRGVFVGPPPPGEGMPSPEGGPDAYSEQFAPAAA